MQRGLYGQNKELYQQHYDAMVELRQQNYGYGTIARKLDVPVNVVRTCVQHIPVDRGKATTLGLVETNADVPYEDVGKAGRRARLIRERGHRCEECGLDTWNGKPITLELHNHTLSETEAKLLCPNCHAQTDNWRRTRS